MNCCLFSGVHLSFTQKVIANNSYVILDDIGHTDDTALVCHTNYTPPHGHADSDGDWYAPNGKRVGGDNGPSDLGFVRNRGPHVVRLKRSTAGTPLEGTYRCVIQDNTKNNQTVYVRLMNGMCYNVFLAQTYNATIFRDQHFLNLLFFKCGWKLCHFYQLYP